MLRKGIIFIEKNKAELLDMKEEQMDFDKVDGIDFDDNNQAILEYDKALARINVTSVEVNGGGRRQFVVSGSKGTIELKPIENETYLTWTDEETAQNPYEDMKKIIDVRDIPKERRYDEMMKDFYSYIIGTKPNPYTYEHELMVHKVLADVCMGYNLFRGNENENEY